MIGSTFAGMNLSVFAADVSVNNRAQWLSKLTKTFDMTVEEDNYPDNYFSDLSSDSAYYRDIMVATEFGLIDVEAGDPVDPEGKITREFAAQTLNFCLGWTLEGQAGEDGTYTFADAADCLYPVDDQVAVNHGWLALSEEGNFLPAQEVTAAEVDTMLNDAAQTLLNDEIDENHENTYEYGEGVIEIPEETIVEFHENSVEIFNTAYTIRENDTFVVYSNGIPVVYTAKKVTKTADSITVQTSDETNEDAVENVDMETEFDVDASTFIPANGFEIVEETPSASISSVSSAKKVTPKDSVKLKKDISLPGGNKIIIDIGIKNIKFSAKQNTAKQTAYAKISCDVFIKIGSEFNSEEIGDIDTDDLDMIGKIPIAGIGFVQFKPELNLTGKSSVEQNYNVEFGFSKDSSGIHNPHSFQKGKFTYVLEASGKIGIKIAVGVNIAAVKVEIYAEVGTQAKAQATRTVDANNNNLFCITIAGYLYFNVGVKLKVDVLAWKFEAKVEWEIYKESNSPVRLCFHIENGKSVENCTADETKYVSPKNTKYGGIYTDTDGNYTFYDTNTELRYSVSSGKATITGYSGTPVNVVIPSTIQGCPVTSIGRDAFRNCSSLTSITIPDSVTSIGIWAFTYCRSLTSITIPNSVTSIGERAFGDCRSLTSITIPNSVTSIGSYAFSCCSSLTSITIPKSVTSIGEAAFVGCSGLTSITIPNSVTSIGSSAFQGCSGLTSITIPNSVTSIGGDSFFGCSSLTGITIPNSVTSIGYEAFYGCSSLTSITIPDSVTSIGYRAFYGCSSLTGITIPDSVTSIGGYAFVGCSNLTSITIPNSVTSIGSSAFVYCESLTSITIPNSVTSIGSGVFYGCRSLTSVTIGNSVTSIGYEAFYGCSSLTSITIPDSVTSIGYRAFIYCSSLTSITIPNSVTSIRSYAFGSCDNLKDVFYMGTESQWNVIEIIAEGNWSFKKANIIFNYVEHEHIFGEGVVTEAPDCYTTGTKTYTCSVCGYKTYETLAALGHKFAASEPYCQNGCGAVNPDYVPPHVHDYTSAITTQPTCTEAGVKTFTCACGDTYTEPVAALGHNYGEWTQTKAPTCTEAGTESRTCTRDGSHLQIQSVPATGHHYSAKVVKPNAGALGYTLHTCAGCRVGYKDTYTAPTGKVSGLKCKTRKANEQTLTWTAVKGACSYVVKISDKTGKKWEREMVVTGNSCTVKKLTAGCNYKFKVKFSLKAGDGKKYHSNWSATIASPTLPTGTTITKLTAGKKAITAQWKKAGFTGYQVQYSVKSNFAGAKKVTIRNAKTLKATVKKLSVKKVYYVRIRTYKTISNVYYFSTWSKTYKVKTK